MILSKDNLSECYDSIGRVDFRKIRRNFTIPEHLSFTSSSSEAVYCLLNDIIIEQKCKECANSVEFMSRSEGYRDFCSVQCATRCSEIQDSKQSTCMKKYGVSNPFQIKSVRDTVEQNNMKKYGTKCALNSNKSIEKAKATRVERYGEEYMTSTSLFSEKAKATRLEKYNTEYILGSKYLKDLMQKKYGVDHPMQSGEISEKAMKNSYRCKDYRFPSGKLISVQGYEPYLLDELVEHYQETDIITSRSEMPEFWYHINSKRHRYFPDVFIPSTNTIFEVKSEFTLKKSKENGIYFQKMKSVLDAGYNYVLKTY